jgi:hypothetical protein
MRTLAILLDAHRELLPDLVEPWQLCGAAVVTVVSCYMMIGDRRRFLKPTVIAVLWAGTIGLQVDSVMRRFDPNEEWTASAQAAAVLVAVFPLFVIAALSVLRHKPPNKAPEPTATAVTSPAAQEPRHP